MANDTLLDRMAAALRYQYWPVPNGQLISAEKLLKEYDSMKAHELVRCTYCKGTGAINGK